MAQAAADRGRPAARPASSRGNLSRWYNQHDRLPAHTPSTSSCCCFVLEGVQPVQSLPIDVVRPLHGRHDPGPWIQDFCMVLDQGGVIRQPASTLHSAWQRRRPASRSCGQRPDTRACRLHLQRLRRSGGLNRSARSVGALQSLEPCMSINCTTMTDCHKRAVLRIAAPA